MASNILVTGNSVRICYFSEAFKNEKFSYSNISSKEIKKLLDSFAVNIINEINGVFNINIPVDAKITNSHIFDEFDENEYSYTCFCYMVNELYDFCLNLSKTYLSSKSLCKSNISILDYPVISLTFTFNNNQEATCFAKAL